MKAKTARQTPNKKEKWTTLWKLTNDKDQTYGGCQWGNNVTVETSGMGELCGKGFTHWYTDPLLAVLLNPIHGNFDIKTAHLWKGKGIVTKTDKGLKVGCIKATTLERVELPTVTIIQCVAFGILCAKKVCGNRQWIKWADKWLDGSDRTAESAWSAAKSAEGLDLDLAGIAHKALEF